MGAPHLIPRTVYSLRILEGESQGLSFVLRKNQIHIGRETSNDIVLNDNKVSRDHALIVIGEAGIFIKNLNPKNKTIVNGQEVSEIALVPGSEILIGDTKLFLQLEVQEAAAPQNLSRSSKGSQEESNKKLKFYLIAGGVLALLIYLGTSDSSSPEDKYNFRNEEAIQEEISETQKRKQELETQYFSSGKDSAQYLQAESNYQQGSREYREGNYNRAISYFNAALSLYPKHILARRYLTQARRKLSEEVQYSLSMANSLKEKAKYKEAISYYRHVMILLNDPNDISYQEAKALHDESLLKLKGAY